MTRPYGEVWSGFHRIVSLALAAVLLAALGPLPSAAQQSGEPAAPTSLAVADGTLTWDQPDNGVTVGGWNIYLDDVYVATVNAPTRSYDLPPDGRNGVYYVVAFDDSDPARFSPQSDPLSVGTGGPPDPGPGPPAISTRPTNLTVTANAAGEAVLDWDSTATEFQINRCGPREGETDTSKCEPLAFPINIGYLANVSDQTTFTDPTTAGTSDMFVYRVDALDGGGKSDVIAFRNGPQPTGGQAGPHPDAEPNPMFSDEFNGTELDDQRWETSHRWGSEVVINSEPQHYVDVQAGEAEAAGDNPFDFTGSALRITASDTPFSDQPYTSGVITLRGVLHLRLRRSAGEPARRVGSVARILAVRRGRRRIGGRTERRDRQSSSTSRPGPT